MSSLTTNSIISLHHFLAVILIVAPLGSILLLLISALLFFTPPESKKRPVFILNILACLLGICQAIYFACLNSYVILHPDEPISHTIALTAIAILLGPPIFIDSILFVRLLAFYPIRFTAPSTLFAILTPAFLWKAARLACLTSFLVTYPITRFNGPSYVTLPGLVWGRGPWIVALLALQAADNSFVSAIFLYKLYQYGYHKPEAHGNSSNGITPAIFTITLGNFVVPLTIDVTLIVLVVFLPGWFSGAYVIFVANFITIIGIMFATVWAINQSRMMRPVA
ncbi:hypothetical protein V8E52_009634 [Russula decolorans]